MSYVNIDPVISSWAEAYGLHIQKAYKEFEVRSIDIVDNQGKRYQIWIDIPSEEGSINVHAWDYNKRCVDFITNIPGLRRILDKAYITVTTWVNP